MKKKWIILLVVIAVIVAVMVYNHYVPLWFNLTSLVFIGTGIVLDRLIIWLYNSYIKKGDTNE